MYDMPQIRLCDLLLDIPENDIQEIWEVSYILTTSTSKPHYVVVLMDSTSLCTCMLIINQGMPCRHQYRIFLQSAKAIFHLDFIHTRWFNIVPSAETMNRIIISQGVQGNLLPLHHIDRFRTGSVYTENIRENVNKKIKFGTTMSVAKTSVQIAVSENTTSELIGILTQFIMKYRQGTGLGVVRVEDAEEIHSEIELPNRQPLSDLNSNYNISEISNPEYHRAKGRPPKRYKSSVEQNTSKSTTSFKTCSYCLGKGHNIRGCAKYKLDKEN